MTLKELMLGNIQSNPETAFMQMGAQATQKAGGNRDRKAFCDILGTRMNPIEDKQSGSKMNTTIMYAGRKNTESISDKADNKPRYLSFREANDKSLKASESAVGREMKCSENHDSQLDKVEDHSKKRTAQDHQPDNMLHIFAHVLGLDIKDMQKLLKEAGIQSESFNNMQDISVNASKLTQLLGLNSDQQDTLAKMLQLTAKTLDSLAGVSSEEVGKRILPLVLKSVNEGDETGETHAAIEGNQDVSAVSSIESLATKLNLKIKMTLKEFSNKIEVDQSAVEAELKQLLQTLLEKPAVMIQEPVQQHLETNTADPVEQIVTAIDVKADTAAPKEDGTGQEANGKTEKETEIQQPVAVLKENPTLTTFVIAQPDKVNAADGMEKAAAPSPVANKEIISQVIEKAKVILTPDKSEMLMELKPDSLGKISLKVITENGIVMAKFIAESQQVRQVLEANMHLLKDSLEKQGMSVQGFSVSVRQESNRQTEDHQQNENSRSHRVTGTAYRTADIQGNLAGILEATGRSNPYQLGSSTINLTA